jgi:hypothetical protein
MSKLVVRCFGRRLAHGHSARSGTADAPETQFEEPVITPQVPACARTDACS